MRRLLIVVVLLVAGGAGLGFSLGWFRLSTADTGRTTTVNVTVDKGKVEEDREKAKEKLRELERQAQDRLSRHPD